jgi:hypothetical protein
MPYLSYTRIVSLACLPGCDHHQAYEVRVLSSHISSASKESGKSSCHPNSASASTKIDCCNLRVRALPPQLNILPGSMTKRRYGSLVAVVLETMATLTDEILDLHDRFIGSLFNKAKRKHDDAFQASGKAIIGLGSTRQEAKANMGRTPADDCEGPGDCYGELALCFHFKRIVGVCVSYSHSLTADLESELSLELEPALPPDSLRDEYYDHLQCYLTASGCLLFCEAFRTAIPITSKCAPKRRSFTPMKSRAG